MVQVRLQKVLAASSASLLAKAPVGAPPSSPPPPIGTLVLGSLIRCFSSLRSTVSPDTRAKRRSGCVCVSPSGCESTNLLLQKVQQQKTGSLLMSLVLCVGAGGSVQFIP